MRLLLDLPLRLLSLKLFWAADAVLILLPRKLVRHQLQVVCVIFLLFPVGLSVSHANLPTFLVPAVGALFPEAIEHDVRAVCSRLL